MNNSGQVRIPSVDSVYRPTPEVQQSSIIQDLVQLAKTETYVPPPAFNLYQAPAPTTTYETPATVYYAPTPVQTYEAPATVFRAPTPVQTYEAPATVYYAQTPVQTYEAPATVYRAPTPVQTYEAPATVYYVPTPVQTYEAPATVYRAPTPVSTYVTPSPVQTNTIVQDLLEFARLEKPTLTRKHFDIEAERTYSYIAPSTYVEPERYVESYVEQARYEEPEHTIIQDLVEYASTYRAPTPQKYVESYVEPTRTYTQSYVEPTRTYTQSYVEPFKYVEQRSSIAQDLLNLVRNETPSYRASTVSKYMSPVPTKYVDRKYSPAKDLSDRASTTVSETTYVSSKKSFKVKKDKKIELKKEAKCSCSECFYDPYCPYAQEHYEKCITNQKCFQPNQKYHFYIRTVILI